MKGVQCYELFGGITFKNHTFSSVHNDGDELSHHSTHDPHLSSKHSLIHRFQKCSVVLFLNICTSSCPINLSAIHLPIYVIFLHV